MLFSGGAPSTPDIDTRSTRGFSERNRVSTLQNGSKQQPFSLSAQARRWCGAIFEPIACKTPAPARVPALHHKLDGAPRACRGAPSRHFKLFAA